MTYRFGIFELDEEAGELRRAGEPVAIQPKPLALLSLLIRERGRVVPNDELLEALWPDTVVSPGSLNRAVSHARRALDDTGRGELLRSFSRRGYRFMGEVAELEIDGGPGRTPPRPAPSPGRRSGTTPPAADPRAEAGDPGELDFIGRREPLTRLLDLAQQVARGRGAIALLTGRAGVGKTRLAEVFSARADRQGFRVVHGRCRDRDGAPPFWLWTQTLRRLAEDEAFREILAEGEEGGALAPLSDALGRHRGEPRQPAAPADPDTPAEQQRFLFFDATTRALLACAARRPLVLVLEDLQWAGQTSLRLLEHLAGEIREAPILILATVRDEPRETGHPVERAQAVLRQQGHTLPIALAGLSRGEVGELLSRRIGRPSPVDLTSELFARTEGIPFFVMEALRLLDERGDLARPDRIPRQGVLLPARAVDLIRQSLDGLGPGCSDLLGVASVLGREFTLTFLAAVAETPRAEALDRLDEALLAGIVEEAEDGVASYHFTHALFQEAIYDGLAAGLRARLHLRAAERFERQHGDALEPVLAELAHHHHRAIAVGDPERAYRFAMRAAAHAERLFAYEQAALHYVQAADALDHAEAVDPRQRVETLLALGEAHRLSGDRDKRIGAFQKALDGARALGDDAAFARAAIGLCEVSEWSVADERDRAWVEEALERVAPGDVRARARLTTRLAYLSVRKREVAEPPARDGAALARSCGDPEALQEALYVLHYTIAGPDDLDERAETIHELVAAARQCANRDASVIAVLDVACDALTRGDLALARRMRDAARDLSGRYASPGMVWHTRVWDTGLALLEGRLGEVEQRAQDALLVGRRIGHPYAKGCFHAQRVFLARERGDHETIVSRFGPGLTPGALGPTHWMKAVVGRAECARGNRDRARLFLDELAESGFQGFARNIRWSATIVETAMLCAELAAADHAKALLALLEPVRDHHGVLPIPILYAGPVSRCMAALWSLLGDGDAAIALYEEAVDSALGLGAAPTLARLRLEAAPLLARAGDGARAREWATDSARAAAELGLPEVEAGAERLLARL